MKTSALRLSAFAVVFLLPALAQAHPGHEGDHGFGWDFNHLQKHPYATFVCGILLYATGWIAWRLLARRAATRPMKVKH